MHSTLQDPVHQVNDDIVIKNPSFLDGWFQLEHSGPAFYIATDNLGDLLASQGSK
jgi:hypothetical protein